MSADVLDLRKLQDSTLVLGEAVLKGEGALPPLSFLACHRRRAENLRKELKLEIDFLRPDDAGVFENMRAHESVVAVVPRVIPWQRQYEVIRRTMDDAGKEAMSHLVSVGRTVGFSNDDEMYRRIVRGFIRASGGDEMDIVNLAIRQIAESVGAFAIIQLTEAYIASGEDAMERRKKYGYKDCKSDPLSKEVVACTLESRTLKRIVMREIIRVSGKRDEGPVLRLGELRETTNEEGRQLSGRFVSILSPLPGEERAS